MLVTYWPMGEEQRGPIKYAILYHKKPLLDAESATGMTTLAWTSQCFST